MNTVRQFTKYYKPYKHLFLMDMICAFVVSGIDLAFPLFVRFLMNDVYSLPHKNRIVRYIIIFGIILFALYILRYLCQYFITSWGHIMGAKMETDMRRDLFGHLQKLSFSYYDETNTGKLMSHIVNDLFDISELAHHGPEDLFISVLKLGGTFIILSIINIKLTLILILFTAIMLYFSYFYNKKMRDVFAVNREKIALVNAIAQDSLGGIRVVKSFANEEAEVKKFAVGNQAFLDTKCDSYYIMGKFFSGNSFFQGVLYLTVILAGGLFIIQGSLNILDLTTYVLYINTFLQPIEKLINFTEQFQKGITGFERFLEVLNTEPEIKDESDAKDIANIKGDIEFHNVSFSYNEKEDVLTDINIKIEAGKTVALVGPSGGGKTTFCSLIPRFYEVTSGYITIDDKDIRKFTQRSLRSIVGVVQQEVYLFSGSIKENIAYGKPEATDEDIILAAQKANIHDFIMTLPEGYDTYVGERGVKLSGGQKQRISIARVFLKNPPILILDEATSALDNESERYIQKSLEELSKNRTTLVIAHRLSTIKNAAEIIVLTEEGIKEKGNHNELLNKEGFYSYLYNMQFEL